MKIECYHQGLYIEDSRYKATDKELLRYEWSWTDDGVKYKNKYRMRYNGKYLYLLTCSSATKGDVTSPETISLILGPFALLHERMYNNYVSVAYRLWDSTHLRSRGEYWTGKGASDTTLPYNQNYPSKMVVDRMVSRDELFNAWKDSYLWMDLKDDRHETTKVVLYSGKPFSEETHRWAAYNACVEDWSEE